MAVTDLLEFGYLHTSPYLCRFQRTDVLLGYLFAFSDEDSGLALDRVVSLQDGFAVANAAVRKERCQRVKSVATSRATIAAVPPAAAVDLDGVDIQYS